MTSLPPWLVMCGLALVLWAGCKWATLATPAIPRPLPRRRLSAYLLGWPGMNADSFLATARVAKRPSPGEWWAAAFKLVVGIALTWSAAGWVAGRSLFLAAWLGMAGLVLCLHFGVFHLLSLLWRARGVEAPALMDRPHVATSVADFWGRRWNTGFHELAWRFVFRPLRRRIGPETALVAAFLASGLIHEVVITVPACGGWGRPTAYFLIQAAGVLVERTAPARRIGLATGIRGWLFTMSLVIAPLGWLFPPPFVERVMVPFLQLIQAL